MRCSAIILALALLAASTAPAAEPAAPPITVTTTADSGPGSLRNAIEQANRTGGKTAIGFAVPKTDRGFDRRTGVWTITWQDTPPSLTVSDVLLDAQTQTAAQGDTNPAGPEIRLDGNDHSIEYGFSLIGVSGCTIRGFAITGFLYGIQVHGRQSHHNMIVGNYIGISPDGATSAPATGNYNGIELIGGAHRNTIGGMAVADRNIISGNQHIGVRLSDANDNRVIGNYIGTDAAGAQGVPNYDGINIEGRAANNSVGDADPAGRNIISGNVAYGVDLFGWGVTGNRVIGNHIGTDVTGTRAIPNTYGVLFDDRSNGNIVGGDGPGEGNLISGNTAFGAYVYNNGTRANIVRGNRIGTDITGTMAIPNETGVHIDGATRDNLVDNNTISGNVVAGITLFALYTDGNRIIRNRIGTDVTGAKPLGNGADGIRIAFGPRNNTIGGADADANIIAHNGSQGIATDAADAKANHIANNRVFGNGKPRP
jgi:parallel beta-helix repeat protein